MYLTRIEERMLSGEYGEAVADAMRVLVKVGEALGADRLIEISHAHVSGISYYTIGEPGLLFIESFRRKGARVSVFSTINPVGMDMFRWSEIGIPERFAEKQKRIVEAMIAMGFKESMTCTPYLIRRPGRGEHLAWGESSAVGMANTYYGAHTNREGGPLALMAAIAGRTYRAGLHIPENREPTAIVELENDAFLADPALAGLTGYVVGERLGTGVPYIKTGLKPGFTSIKSYTAAAGASGGIALSIIEGVTPGYRKARSGLGGLERIVIDKREIESRLPPPDLEPDIIFIGCPHADMEEIFHLKHLLSKCREKTKAQILVSTSRVVYWKAEALGIISFLERNGVTVIRDTCPVVSPIIKGKARVVLTTSSKSLFYLPRMHGVRTFVSPLNRLEAYICRQR